jgi:hypothetical protein
MVKSDEATSADPELTIFGCKIKPLLLKQVTPYIGHINTKAINDNILIKCAISLF